MADKIYLDIQDQLLELGGGADPSGFNGSSDLDDLLSDYTRSVANMGSFMGAGMAPAAPPPTAAQQVSPQVDLPQSSQQVGLLQRPQQFISELLLGGDPMKALLEGRATTETLGRTIFPGAQKPGFQMSDLPAFAVDVLSDPLTYALPPILAKSFGMFSKLFGTATKLPFFADSVADIMQRTGHGARLKGLRSMWKPVEEGGLGMTDEWFSEILKDARVAMPGQILTTSAKKAAKIQGSGLGASVLNPQQLDQVLSHMQNLQYQVFKPRTGLFGSIAQRAGLYLAPIVSVLEKQGGVYGQRLATGINNTLRGTYTNYGRVLQDYIKVIEDLKLDNAGATAVRKASTLIAEAGGPTARISDVLSLANKHGSVPAEVMEVLSDPQKFSLASRLSGKTREVFDLYKNILSGFRDAGGRQFMVQFDDGVRPFAEAIQPNYVAHVFKWDELNPGTKQFEQFLTNFMKQNGIDSRAVARDVFETMVRKTPKKFGNIEHARMFNLGGYELDPLEFMPKWLYNTEYRLNFAKQFGLGGTMRHSNSASQLIRAMKEAGRAGDNAIDSKWLDDVEAILLDRHPRNYEVSELMRKITGFQVLTKMGLGSSVANLSQNVNTGTVFGFRNFLRGVANTFTDEGARFSALAYNRATKDSLNEMITGSARHGFAGRFLDAIGFNFIEKWNRFFAANSGVAALRNWSAQLAKLPPGTPAYARMTQRMQRLLGVTEPELVRLASGQGPSGAMLDRAALLASEHTQHATNWSQVPKLWQIPEARIALQYKNFAYNQTRFMFQHVIGPAVEFVQSRGASGDIGPLLRAAPLFTTAGHAVQHLRELIRMPTRGALTGDWKAKEKWLWEQDEDWLVAALKDSLAVGSLGVMGDAFTSAERGKLPQWILGPTIGDLSELATRGVKLGQKVSDNKDMSEEFEKFVTWAGRKTVPAALAKVPGVGFALAAGAQTYPYDVYYEDLDLDRFSGEVRGMFDAELGR